MAAGAPYVCELDADDEGPVRQRLPAHPPMDVPDEGTRVQLARVKIARQPSLAPRPQLPHPRGQHGSRDARDAALHLAEAPAPAEELPHDEKRPPLAEKIQGARNRAELTVALHVRTISRLRPPRGADFVPRPRRARP